MKKKCEDKVKCRLCENLYNYLEMSEEHYPAKCVGNDDIVSLDLLKMFDELQSGDLKAEISEGIKNGKDLNQIAGDIFDKKLSKSMYPKGRTVRSLCKKCNNFLGKYDEAYLKFFNCDGKPKPIKSFQTLTKYKIIKSIYGKFLSVPETINEQFDFLDFIKDESATQYNGKWKIYFIKRDYSTDLLGLKDIRTGVEYFDDGVLYEMSDDKFIFNLMNFEKHDCFEMTNVFDILKKDYSLVKGVGDNGGYHGQLLITSLLKNIDLDNYKNK